jgi:hypothetical protein
MASESENYIRRSMELAKVAAKIFPFKKIIQGEKHIRNPDPDSYWKILPDGCYVRKYFKMLNSLPCTYEDYYTIRLRRREVHISQLGYICPSDVNDTYNHSVGLCEKPSVIVKK